MEMRSTMRPCIVVQKARELNLEKAYFKLWNKTRQAGTNFVGAVRRQRPLDSPLTLLGFSNSINAGKQLKTFVQGFDHIYLVASYLNRTQHTALHVASQWSGLPDKLGRLKLLFDTLAIQRFKRYMKNTSAFQNQTLEQVFKTFFQKKQQDFLFNFISNNLDNTCNVGNIEGSDLKVSQYETHAEDTYLFGPPGDGVLTQNENTNKTERIQLLSMDLSSFEVLFTGHITQTTTRYLQAFSEVEYSKSPFNVEVKGVDPNHLRGVDVPAFDFSVKKAVTDLFKYLYQRWPHLMTTETGPTEGYDSFVMEKLLDTDKMKHLYNYLDESKDPTAETTKRNIEQYMQFLVTHRDRFKSGKYSFDQFHQDLTSQLNFPKHWYTQQHYDKIFRFFGASQQLSNQINQATVNTSKGEAELRAEVRWLPKSFGVFAMKGTPADVVNVIYMIKGLPEPQNTAETPARVSRVILHLLEKLKDYEYTKNINFIRRLPKIFIHDAEPDDMWSWSLLNVLYTLKHGIKVPDVRVQLPEDRSPCKSKNVYLYPIYEPLRDHFDELGAKEVITDPHARNCKALYKFWKSQNIDIEV